MQNQLLGDRSVVVEQLGQLGLAREHDDRGNRVLGGIGAGTHAAEAWWKVVDVCSIG